jgi:hypothetical protein
MSSPIHPPNSPKLSLHSHLADKRKVPISYVPLAKIELEIEKAPAETGASFFNKDGSAGNRT